MSARALTSSASEVECCLLLCAAGVLLLETDGKGKTTKNIISAITKFPIKTVLVSFFSSFFHFFLRICLSLVHQRRLYVTFSLSHLHLPIGYFVCFRAHSFLSSFRFFLIFFAIHMRAKDACKSFAWSSIHFHLCSFVNNYENYVRLFVCNFCSYFFLICDLALVFTAVRRCSSCVYCLSATVFSFSVSSSSSGMNTQQKKNLISKSTSRDRHSSVCAKEWKRHTEANERKEKLQSRTILGEWVWGAHSKSSKKYIYIISEDKKKSYGKKTEHRFERRDERKEKEQTRRKHSNTCHCEG